MLVNLLVGSLNCFVQSSCVFAFFRFLSLVISEENVSLDYMFQPLQNQAVIIFMNSSWNFKLEFEFQPVLKFLDKYFWPNYSENNDYCYIVGKNPHLQHKNYNIRLKVYIYIVKT
jgi:hypothetical protein